MFLKLKISANEATFIRLIFFLIGALLVLLSYNYLGYFFLYLNFIFDNVDGQICRVTKKASYSGQFCDGLLDNFSHVVFPVIIAIAVINDNSNSLSIIIYGLLSSTLNVLYLYTNIRFSLFLKIVKRENTISNNFIISYIENRMLADWWDFKYFSFLIFCFLKMETYFILMCFIVNLIFFILTLVLQIIKAIKILNINKVSKSQKNSN